MKQDYNAKKINRLKLQIAATIFLLLLIISSCFFVFSPVSLRQLAFALQGNYDRVSPAGDQLNMTDWNYLDEDFVWREGDTMTGSLNMGGNSITNLAHPPVGNNDASTKQYVDTEIANAIAGMTGGGGDIFINWGRDDCPAAFTELYDGIGYSARYDSYAGGSNPICMRSGDAGAAFPGIYADKLYPLVTGIAATLPSDGSFSDQKIIKCAVCYQAGRTCFEKWGSHNCDATGFSATYSGYMLGSLSDDPSDAFTDTHHNSTERGCVNRNFDNSITAPGWGSIWYGSRVEDDYGQGYPTAFIKCAVCCN